MHLEIILWRQEYYKLFVIPFVLFKFIILISLQYFAFKKKNSKGTLLKNILKDTIFSFCETTAILYYVISSIFKLKTYHELFFIIIYTLLHLCKNNLEKTIFFVMGKRDFFKLTKGLNYTTLKFLLRRQIIYLFVYNLYNND